MDESLRRSGDGEKKYLCSCRQSNPGSGGQSQSLYCLRYITYSMTTLTSILSRELQTASKFLDRNQTCMQCYLYASCTSKRWRHYGTDIFWESLLERNSNSSASSRRGSSSQTDREMSWAPARPPSASRTEIIRTL